MSAPELPESYDLIVIGGGPAGQKAAIQAAKLGRRVLLVDRQRAVGGECVHRGTIPSKSLRESAVYLSGLRQRTQGLLDLELSGDVKVASLMRRLDTVLGRHEHYMESQLRRNGIELRHGRARFLSPHELEIASCEGGAVRARADFIVIATGSRPRRPPGIPVDHEHVLDSDSILSLIYLPRSLTVLGSGVIAAEFASIFAALGVEVTMIDRYERPLGFLDPELTDCFTRVYERQGGRFLPLRKVRSVAWDGVATVVTELEDGEVLHSDKVLCAQGRVAELSGLELAAAGLAPDALVCAATDDPRPFEAAAGDGVARFSRLEPGVLTHGVVRTFCNWLERRAAAG